MTAALSPPAPGPRNNSPPPSPGQVSASPQRGCPGRVPVTRPAGPECRPCWDTRVVEAQAAGRGPACVHRQPCEGAAHPPTKPCRPRCGPLTRQRGCLGGRHAVATLGRPANGAWDSRPMAIHSLYLKRRRFALSCLYTVRARVAPTAAPPPVGTAPGWSRKCGPGQRPRTGASSDPENVCAVALLSELCLGVARSRGPRGLWAPPPNENCDRPVGQRFDDTPGLEPRESLHRRARQVQDLVSRLDRLSLPRGRPWEQGQEAQGVRVTGGRGQPPHPHRPPRRWGARREQDVPVKIRLTVRGLSPSREPFPPSRLKPSPAEVFSSVTAWTVASAAGADGPSGRRCSSGPAHGSETADARARPSSDVDVRLRHAQAPPPGPPPRGQNLPDSAEASPAPGAEAAGSSEELGSGTAPGAGLLVTITACLGSRAWRRMASASWWEAPLRDLPLMERTASPFWTVPSWEASPFGKTLWTWEGAGGQGSARSASRRDARRGWSRLCRVRLLGRREGG